jgi:hypothetical protein
VTTHTKCAKRIICSSLHTTPTSETARNDIVLPIRSESGAAPTGDDVGAIFRQDSAAVLDTEHFRPSTKSNINDFQGLPLNIEHAALLHAHPICTGGYSDGIWPKVPPAYRSGPIVDVRLKTRIRVQHRPTSSETQLDTIQVPVNLTAAQCEAYETHKIWLI